jgi:hypothetical protein
MDLEGARLALASGHSAPWRFKIAKEVPADSFSPGGSSSSMQASHEPCTFEFEFELQFEVEFEFGLVRRFEII